MSVREIDTERRVDHPFEEPFLPMPAQVASVRKPGLLARVATAWRWMKADGFGLDPTADDEPRSRSKP